MKKTIIVLLLCASGVLAQAELVTNSHVVEMFRAGLPSSIIVQKINSFRGNGTQAKPVPVSKVRTVASKDAMTAGYVELGIAKGTAPNAQQAVDQAKIHCAQHGGTYLIMNVEPFQSGSNFQVDATCATDGPAK